MEIWRIFISHLLWTQLELSLEDVLDVQQLRHLQNQLPELRMVERSGLTSVVTALCFMLALFLAPLLLMIPSAATGPALIFVGFGLITQIKNLELDDFTESFPAIIMILITAFTASLPTAISAGVLIHVLMKIVTGKAREIHTGLYGLSVFMILYFIFGM